MLRKIESIRAEDVARMIKHISSEDTRWKVALAYS